MKNKIVLQDNWMLQQVGGEVFSIPQMPMMVHDILHVHNKIDDTYQKGNTISCAWVAEQVWEYQVSFLKPGWEETILLTFQGLDTLAEIYLNDQLIGSSKTCYMPASFPVDTWLMEGENQLRVRFDSVPKYLQEMSLQEQGDHSDTVEDCRYLRKSFHDFTTYLGAKPEFLKVGVFGEVALELCHQARLTEVTIDYALTEHLTRADVLVRGEATEGEIFCIEMRDPHGGLVYHQSGNNKEWGFSIENPELWWPRGYGEQPLYTLVVQMLDGKGQELDRVIKKVGLRKTQVSSNLAVQVNNTAIRLWGANLAPIDGRTLCEDQKRLTEIVNLAYDCNMNTLRVWGEGNVFSDILYELADELGILLWQEFFCGHAQYPEDERVFAAILEEAEFLIRRLRHHASILLWCGGNECFMSRDFAAPDKPYLAARLFEYNLRALCKKLDPDRYYHANSPWGGDYTNAPEVGDTHSYTNSWYVPGAALPAFVSENLRVSFPPVRSLKRYLSVEELPAPGLHKAGDLPWPKEYEEVTSAESYMKIGPVEQMYDAATPEEMVYRFGAAAGLYLQESVEGYRRGKTVADAFGQRLCGGHLVWKLNTTFPHIYSSILDYYLEPGIPYYFLKRAYAPVLASLEYGDHIRAWVVNDTKFPLTGTMTAQLFSLADNKVTHELKRPFYVLPGDSTLVTALDEFGQFPRNRAVRLLVYGEDQELLAENSGFADIERHIEFPDPQIDLEWQDGILYLTADRYAHHVELAGEAGEAFGYRFSDNYFSLFPGERKAVVVSAPEHGVVRARGAYASTYSEVQF